MSVWRLVCRALARFVCAIFAFTEVHKTKYVEKTKHYKTTWLLLGKRKTAIICYSFCLSGLLLYLTLFLFLSLSFSLLLPCCAEQQQLERLELVRSLAFIRQTLYNFTWNIKRRYCAYGNLIWMIGMFYNKWIHTNSLSFFKKPPKITFAHSTIRPSVKLKHKQKISQYFICCVCNLGILINWMLNRMHCNE